ncbi:hypothetical protein HMI54_013869 [Coelomomyces lativittatus]|nr:hypothetical protein HMI54_013869 [Coelomomyces lativittatus]
MTNENEEVQMPFLHSSPDSFYENLKIPPYSIGKELNLVSPFHSCFVWDHDMVPEMYANPYLKFKEYSETMDVLMNEIHECGS